MRILDKIAAWCSGKEEVNYVYFAFFLVVISVLSLSYFVGRSPLFGVHLFFIFYTLGQSFLEVCFFILIACMLNRWAPRWLFTGFIGLSFLALLAHYVDFTLLRLMDTSLSYVFKFFFGSGIAHLYTAFLALNMNATMVALIFTSLAAIPLVGIGFYWLTQRWARLNPWRISLGQTALALTTIGSTLLLSDLLAYPYLNRLAYRKYQKALPLGSTFLSPSPNYCKLLRPIAPFRDEEKMAARLREIAPVAKRLPNIYFFIVETFRRDFARPEIAPHLASFGEENISLDHTFSNANSTYLSWFALLHSHFPYHWADVRDQWKGGSIPLRVLKQLGYKVKVYSSADLRYFNMDQVLFGEERKLADSIEEYPSELEPCERDALAIRNFARDVDEEGTLFLFFLDSPHSEYSFPKDAPLKFEPVAKEISYLTIGQSTRDLELLKNRYKNSIAHVDSLLGTFFSTLKEKGLYEDALIAITGDHGEEFFEEGALFHGTHLNHYQTSVPLMCKFPSGWKAKVSLDTMTHIDLFPSIIHCLTGSLDTEELFDGQSIFAKQRWPYRIAVLQNGADAPLEFTLKRGSDTIIARFLESDATLLEILDFQANGIKLPLDSMDHFPEAFSRLMSPSAPEPEQEGPPS